MAGCSLSALTFSVEDYRFILSNMSYATYKEIVFGRGVCPAEVYDVFHCYNIDELDEFADVMFYPCKDYCLRILGTGRNHIPYSLRRMRSLCC